MTTAAICPTWGVLRGASYYRAEQYEPDLDLYYLRARYMNPVTGRFFSRDPEDGIPTDPKTLHKYMYAGGDPVNLSDPTGRAGEGVMNPPYQPGAVEYALVIGLVSLQAAKSLPLVAQAVTCKLDQAGDLLKGVTSDITQPVQQITFGACSTKVGKCKRCEPVEAGQWAYDPDLPPCDPHYFKNPGKLHPPICLPPIQTGENEPHFHLLQMNQTPYPACFCFWNRFNGQVGGTLPVLDYLPGLPIAGPAGGGGPEVF